MSADQWCEILQLLVEQDFEPVPTRGVAEYQGTSEVIARVADLDGQAFSGSGASMASAVPKDVVSVHGSGKSSICCATRDRSSGPEFDLPAVRQRCPTGTSRLTIVGANDERLRRFHGQGPMGRAKRFQGAGASRRRTTLQLIIDNRYSWQDGFVLLSEQPG